MPHDARSIRAKAFEEVRDWLVGLPKTEARVPAFQWIIKDGEVTEEKRITRMAPVVEYDCVMAEFELQFGRWRDDPLPIREE